MISSKRHSGLASLCDNPSGLNSGGHSARHSEVMISDGTFRVSKVRVRHGGRRFGEGLLAFHSILTEYSFDTAIIDCEFIVAPLLYAVILTVY